MIMECPKCNRSMERDNRASSRTREVWECLWNDCRNHEIVLLPDKDEQIEQLQAEIKGLRVDLLRIDNYCRVNDIDLEQACKKYIDANVDGFK